MSTVEAKQSPFQTVKVLENGVDKAGLAASSGRRGLAALSEQLRKSGDLNGALSGEPRRPESDHETAPSCEPAPADADEEALARLAALPTLEYERVRKAEAKRLGVRESGLDKLVKLRKSQPDTAPLQGRAVELPDVEPWPHPVDGAETLNDIAEIFTRYAALPDGAADACALWCAHAHVFPVFLCSPRLNISSPEKGCGKTTLRDVVALFVPRSVLTENMTVAVLFRLVDEYDAWLLDNEELRGLLNAGHRRGATVYRCEGDAHEVGAFGAYAPAVLCGIGALPGTLLDRSIVIRLARARPGEVRARLDDRHTQRERELCRKVARWCAGNLAQLAAADPPMPDGVFNRLADNWRPLFAVAEIAGGDWPDRAARAFATLTSRDDADAQSTGVMLLADIQHILADRETDRISSAELVENLVKMEGRPWAELGPLDRPLTATKLSRMLQSFRIVSATKRHGDETFKGFERAQFAEAFDRYLTCENVTTSQPA